MSSEISLSENSLGVRRIVLGSGSMAGGGGGGCSSLCGMDNTSFFGRSLVAYRVYRNQRWPAKQSAKAVNMLAAAMGLESWTVTGVTRSVLGKKDAIRNAVVGGKAMAQLL